MINHPYWKKIQQYLGIKADGMPGPKTLAAIADKLGVLPLWATVQTVLQVDPDGKPGVVTASALAEKWGITLPKAWPSQAAVRGGNSIFGKAGDAEQVYLTLPYPMRLAWETETVVKRIMCHKLVKDSLERIFQKTLDFYGIDKIQELGLDLYGGCYNNRNTIGGSSKSIHAWGIAVDMDPDHNAYKTKAPKASLSGAEYDAFWSFVEAEGGVSLGRERDYDWMHFQFATL
jgi:hypothetical protein